MYFFLKKHFFFRHTPRPESYADLYLHDTSVKSFCPDLLASFSYPRFFVYDLLQAVASPQRDYWPSLFVGGQATASALHADWGATAAWMGLLQGRKRWVLAPRQHKHLLYERVPQGAGGQEGKFDANLLHPRRDHSHNSSAFPLVNEADLYDDVLEAGEIIFIPGDCPHQVENLERVRVWMTK